jgi:hypothetical protein
MTNRRVGKGALAPCPPRLKMVGTFALCPPYGRKIHLRILAARYARGLLSISRPLDIEGAGNAGRPMRPRSRVQDGVVERTRAYRSHRNHPALPAQWFTAYNVLTSATGLFCHRHPQRLSCELDTSVGVSGPHVFAVRFRRCRLKHPLRPPQPAPRNVTIATRPFWWDRMVRNMDPFWVFCKSEYFCKRGLTDFWVFCPTGKISRLHLRHCEPTGRANARPMTGSAKQSAARQKERVDCFVAALLAMTEKAEIVRRVERFAKPSPSSGT